MSRSVEINTDPLGEDSIPGLREAVGLDELRDELEAAGRAALDVLLYFGGDRADTPAASTTLAGRVAEVGSGVLVFEHFGGDEDERTIVPLNKIVWAKVKRRA